jgi:putative membrane protein
MCLIVPLLIAALVFLLVRRGKIGPPPWVAAARGQGDARFSPFNPASPEFEARRTLATRFANGEMSPEEFLERAAALNWTPGVDHRPDGNGTK